MTNEHFDKLQQTLKSYEKQTSRYNKLIKILGEFAERKNFFAQKDCALYELK